MSANEMKDQKLVIRSEDFRRFAADTFGLHINNNMVHLTFSLETVDENDQQCRVVEATALMAPPSFKVLTILLSGALELIEKQGGPIQLAPGKEEQLRKKLEDASSQKP